MPASSARRSTPVVAAAPPLRALTVGQLEVAHPGVTGRIRTWIKRADAGDPAFVSLRHAIARVGRVVLIDEVKFREFLYQRTAAPPAAPRNPTGINTPRSTRRARRAR